MMASCHQSQTLMSVEYCGESLFLLSCCASSSLNNLGHVVDVNFQILFFHSLERLSFVQAKMMLQNATQK